jgi:hypothetical protein
MAKKKITQEPILETIQEPVNEPIKEVIQDSKVKTAVNLRREKLEEKLKALLSQRAFIDGEIEAVKSGLSHCDYLSTLSGLSINDVQSEG